MNKIILKIILSVFLIFICSCEDNLSSNSPNGLVIIIKADDLGDTTANWNKFIKLIEDNKICASIGVVPAQVKKAGSKEEIVRVSKLRMGNRFPVIEFWNHGYDHSRKNGISEFSSPDLKNQIDHIQKTQSFLYNTLKSTCHTFGAPFNKTSGVTSSALDEFPEINVWLCYQSNEKQLINQWKDPNMKVIYQNDKHLILNVDYLFLHDFEVGDLINNYEIDKEKPYISIQIHPAMWDNSKFDKFDKMIHFYKDRHLAIFMTPYQYYKYLHKGYAPDEN